MKNSVLRYFFAASLLATLALPALADGLPVPWPKKASTPVLELSGHNGSTVQNMELLIVDGLPVPWPKKLINVPAVQADGLPVPWPKKINVQQKMNQSPLLQADGLPVPWPKK
jgi:hypothetical protein